MTDDKKAGLLRWNIGCNRSRPMEQQFGHPGIVSHGFAIFNCFARATRHRSIKFKFSGNNYLGEITFADKVWYDVDFVVLDHPQDLSKAWLLFPEAAVHFSEQPAPDDLTRMLQGWRTRTGIQG